MDRVLNKHVVYDNLSETYFSTTHKESVVHSE